MRDLSPEVAIANLGDAVRAQRTAWGMTQQQLAWASQTSRSTIRRIESGHAHDFVTAVRVTRVLGIDLDEAVRGTAVPHAQRESEGSLDDSTEESAA